jgi:hypothetical protein
MRAAFEKNARRDVPIIVKTNRLYSINQMAGQRWTSEMRVIRYTGPKNGDRHTAKQKEICQQSRITNYESHYEILFLTSNDYICLLVAPSI